MKRNLTGAEAFVQGQIDALFAMFMALADDMSKEEYEDAVLTHA